MLKSVEQSNQTGIELAVIGMSGRFPGARDIHQYWANLKNGIESLSFLSSDELEKAGIALELRQDKNYVETAGGVIENLEHFDASFFDYSPLEAIVMHPQMRIFHECAWEALEDAGYDPRAYNGSIGIYAGAYSSFYWQGVTHLSGKCDELGVYDSNYLNDSDFMATRIAYKLGLKGPAFTVQTACSTSLVAIHLACQGLLNGECDMALAGGVTITPGLSGGYMFQEGMVFSPDGHCRAFDARARGTTVGNGAGIVLLKPLEDAIDQKDHIYALVKGAAINNDGIRKIGYTAPSMEGQAEVIRTALQLAEAEPESIGYLEAQGTGTLLGDPVEIQGLKLAFNTQKKGYCAIGSVKTNIGHLDVAAGVAGFIKTVLALKHRQIPPNLHFETPNPKIDFDNSPFYVNRTLSPWKNDKYPLRAGVNSFGIGGTNAHVVLEEAPPPQPSSGSRKPQLILLSAKSASALDQMSINFARFLKENPGLNLADAAYTLKLGRSYFKQRQILVASTHDEAAAALTPGSETQLYDPEKVFRSFTREEIHPVFMFPGQGSQYINMGLDLYREEPAFTETMDRCFEIFRSLMGYDIKEILYPESDKSDMSDRSDRSDSSDSSDRSDINRTEIAQPVIFMVEYALALLLMKWGIKPYAMMGHSIGEYMAACLSGVFSLEDAIRLVAIRGKFMQPMAPGAMLSVPLSEQEVLPLLTPGLDLAAVNAPNLCVVSGPTEAINRLAHRLKEKDFRTHILHTSHTFHSQSMEPMLEEFEREVAKTSLKKPGIPYISNLTGTWITVEQATDPGYWARHLRNPVRFADGLTELLKDKNSLLVEVGPGRALVTFARQHPLKKPDQETINLVRHPQEKISDTAYLLEKIGRIWMAGQYIDWQAFYAGQQRQRIPLPLYPFQRKSFRISPGVFDNIRGSALVLGASQLDRKKELRHWFYLPSWKRSLLPDPGMAQRLKDEGQTLNWLFFMDDCGIGAKMVQFLIQAGHHVVTVVMGSGFAHLEQNAFALVPGKDEDYATLLNWLEKEEKLPQRVVHLWNVTAAETPGWGSTWNEEKIQHYLDMGFYSLLYLAQAIGKKNIKEEMRITVFTNRALEATGHETIWPEKAGVLGPVNVIPQEYLNIFCSAVDIVFPVGEGERGGEEHLVRDLLDEISSTTLDTVIAYRGNYRLVQDYEAVTINQPHQEMPRLKERGVYLVTGGLGGIGLVLARYLAQQVKARLILTGRSVFPPRQEWDQWLNTHSAADPVSSKILKVKELESLGAEVKVFSVDVVDYPGMKEMVEQVRRQWGSIDGVIHAAGLPGGGIIQLKTREIADPVLLPKIKGTLVLETVLKGIPLDFILLCSSVNSVIPTLGQVDYSAANAFLDAYAFYKNTAHGIFTVSVNWDAWQEVGMAAEAAKGLTGKTAVPGPQPLQNHMTGDEKGLLPETTTGELNESQGYLPGTGILPAEGVEVFRRLLAVSGRAPQVVVSTIDLPIRIARQKQAVENQLKSDARDREPGQERPEISSAYVEPRNDTEKTIAKIFQAQLGIHGIGIDDDFFELGGDSLKAIAVTGKIRKNTRIEVPLAEFFNNPTVKKLAQFITGKKTGEIMEIIEPVEKKDYYILSPAQERLYVLYCLAPQNTGYNIPGGIELSGEVDKERVEKAAKKIIQHHECLRTSFVTIDGKPAQRVHDQVEFKLDYYDLAAQGGGKHEVLKGFVRPFQLEKAPLLRIGLIKTAENKHILTTDIHHIITDAHSILVIFPKDFNALYAGDALPPLQIQYKDFSQWQNRHRSSPAVKKHEEFWQEEFKDGVPVLDLPLDYVRPAKDSYQGDWVIFHLNPAETGNFRKILREFETTLFMGLLALYNVLLFKLSGQEDMVVGTPTAGRSHPDLLSVMGMFVNMLVLRNFPQGKKTFSQFLKEVKERALTAFAHQDYQFENLVEKLAQERKPGRNPLFDVNLTLQNVAEGPSQPAEKPGESLGIETRASKFDLSLEIMEVGDFLYCKFEYKTQLFKRETIRRFAAYFKEILAAVIKDKNIRLEDIRIAHDLMEPTTKTPEMEFKF